MNIKQAEISSKLAGRCQKNIGVFGQFAVCCEPLTYVCYNNELAPKLIIRPRSPGNDTGTH